MEFKSSDQVNLSIFTISVTAKFSDPTQGSTVTTDTFVVRDQAGNSCEGRRSLVDDNKTIRFEPHPAPFNRDNTYTVTITKGITDLTGRAMTADKQWRFTTQQ